jgi:hypothetical protein
MEILYLDNLDEKEYLKEQLVLYRLKEVNNHNRLLDLINNNVLKHISVSTTTSNKLSQEEEDPPLWSGTYYNYVTPCLEYKKNDDEYYYLFGYYDYYPTLRGCPYRIASSDIYKELGIGHKDVIAYLNYYKKQNI